MKINLNNIDLDNFVIKEGSVAGDKVYLVTVPHIGTTWNKDNLIFRSSMWDQNGNPISLSFKKFFNHGEQLELSPPPSQLNNYSIVTKMDGSTLIVTKYKGELILRTRGTINANILDNAFELEVFKSDVLSKYDDNVDTWNYSLIFEWLSPNQRIVINYGDEPSWSLIGKIIHENYIMETQDNLDKIANSYGWHRPERHIYRDITSLTKEVKDWEDKEGCCIYSPCSQDIWKVKSLPYLKCHAFKSNANLDSVLDIYLALKEPSYGEFKNYLVNCFDWECFKMVEDYALQVCNVKSDVQKYISDMKNLIKKCLELPTRKDQALLILSTYGEINNTDMAFNLLDGKELNSKMLKRLYWLYLNT